MVALSGELQRDVRGSWVLRIVAGFVLGVVTGVMAGLLLGLSRRAHAALDPFLSALYTVPKLALLPLLLLIFGLGELPNVLLVGMTVFFLVWITCMEAVMTIPESYREAARSFGAGRWSMFVHVIWPAMLPQLFVAMRISAGTACWLIIGVEFVQADARARLPHRRAGTHSVAVPGRPDVCRHLRGCSARLRVFDAGALVRPPRGAVGEHSPWRATWLANSSTSFCASTTVSRIWCSTGRTS